MELFAAEPPGLLSRKFPAFHRRSGTVLVIFLRLARQNQNAKAARMTPKPTPTPIPAEAPVDSPWLPDEFESWPLEVVEEADDDDIVETSELWYMSCSKGT